MAEEYKVNGLALFAEQFKNFTDNYIIVGGTACSLVMGDAGLDFRATKDIDMIITVEELSREFGEAFWLFINNGGYDIYYSKEGVTQFFRFLNPKDKSYPSMIELFSRKQELSGLKEGTTFTPIVIDEEVSSLSAILLDDNYYRFLKSGREIINGISVLKPTHLIAFKARAYVDLFNKKQEGKYVNSGDLKKHKNDVFRLIQLLTGTEKIFAEDRIKDDMRAFIRLINQTEINLKALNVPLSKEEAINVLEQVFGL